MYHANHLPATTPAESARGAAPCANVARMSRVDPPPATLEPSSLLRAAWRRPCLAQEPHAYTLQAPSLTMTKYVGRWALLTLLHAVLFSVGSALFAPPGLPPLAQHEEALALVGILGMATIDAALLLLFVQRSRLCGWRLAALVAGIFYFVKTLTSQLEAVFFMPNVTAGMLPNLLAMTVPLTLVIAPLAVWLGGRWQPSARDRSPGFAPPGLSPWQLAARSALLSAVVYPALFFLAGWFVAFRSAELRAFYGGAGGDTFLAQLATLEPSVYLLEVLRGALWVACAVAMLGTQRGRAWASTLLVAAWFALLQNDVHFIPNPLMSATIRLHHFVETASSNAVWACAIGGALYPGRRTPN